MATHKPTHINTSGLIADIPSGDTIDPAYLPSSGGMSVALIEDQKTSGTGGGDFTAGAWRDRDLQTIVSDPDGIIKQLTGNKFRLGAGTYLIKWSAPAYKVSSHQTRLYNYTGSAVLKEGATQECDINTITIEPSKGAWVDSPGADRDYLIQHKCVITKTSIGFGDSAGHSTEVYTQVEVYKLA